MKFLNPIVKGVSLLLIVGIIFMGTVLLAADKGGYPQVELLVSYSDGETRKSGRIILELFSDAAPETVANFLSYVESEFYDETLFHRVIDGFMVQGGGMDASMRPKKTRPSIQNEANNRLKNSVGTIAMARTSDPHSATAQFFINVNDNHFLNYKNEDSYGYAVFGRVMKGMSVVKAVKKVETDTQGGYRDVPKFPVIIQSAKRI